MADSAQDGPRAGLTGLVVRVPEAEEAVSSWRARFDPGAAEGVGAHVTVLFPFLPADRIDAEVSAGLGEVLGRHRGFEVRFTRCGRFPEVLYLAPEPAGPLRELVEAVHGRWPEVPPYAGAFSEVVPHLTVAHSRDGALLDRIGKDVSARLPVTCRVASVDLLVHDGVRYRLRTAFPLAV